MTVEQAYRKWVSLAPTHRHVEKQEITYFDRGMKKKTFVEPAHWDGNCCQTIHFKKHENGSQDSKADDEVCPRERAWREYARLRDGNPNLYN